MKAFILAGGFATRLWPLTEHRAKPMLLVDGKPILAHILEQIPESIEVFLLTNSRFEKDFQRFLNSTNYKAKIFCEDAYCDTNKLGALAAVSAAVEHFKINDDLLVLAGDNLLPNLKIEDLFPAEDSVCLAIKTVPSLEDARAFGVVEIDSNLVNGLQKVKTFNEKPEIPVSRYVSTGFMGIGKALLPGLRRFAKKSPDALGAVITDFLARNIEVKASVVEGDWFDVGSYEAYLGAHKALQKRDILLEPGAEMEGCQCQGKVYIGAGARVKNSVLIDAVIYPNTVLEDCHITQSVIDEDCSFRGVDLSRKLIRQGTVLRSE